MNEDDVGIETVAQILRKRVTSNHFTASEVARRAEVSRKYLSGLMTGHARAKSAIFYRLEMVLGPKGLCRRLLYAQSLEELERLRVNGTAAGLRKIATGAS